MKHSFNRAFCSFLYDFSPHGEFKIIIEVPLDSPTIQSSVSKTVFYSFWREWEVQKRCSGQKEKVDLSRDLRLECWAGPWTVAGWVEIHVRAQLSWEGWSWGGWSWELPSWEIPDPRSTQRKIGGRSIESFCRAGLKEPKCRGLKWGLRIKKMCQCTGGQTGKEVGSKQKYDHGDRGSTFICGLSTPSATLNPSSHTVYTPSQRT